MLRGSLDGFWKSIGALAQEAAVVVVHGGGEQSSALAEEMGHEPQFVHGRRITKDLDLRILQWAVRGEISSSLVASAHRNGIRALGMSGADSGMVQVVKRPVWKIDGIDVDFGHVGDVERVDPSMIRTILASGCVPVISPLGVDMSGHLYNVNADTIALELANALSAEQLIFLTSVGGVACEADRNAFHRVPMAVCSVQLAMQGIADGWIAGGMRVKMEAALSALDRGIPTVRIAPLSALRDSRGGTVILRSGAGSLQYSDNEIQTEDVAWRTA